MADEASQSAMGVSVDGLNWVRATVIVRIGLGNFRARENFSRTGDAGG